MLKVFAVLLIFTNFAYAQSASDQGDPNRDSQWSLENEQVEPEHVEESREPASEEVPDMEAPQDAPAE